MARKGLHTDLNKDDSEDSDEVSEQDDSVSVREYGTDTVYINFGAMLKDISRDDLTELYRIVMNRYGMDGPEDILENQDVLKELEVHSKDQVMGEEDSVENIADKFKSASTKVSTGRVAVLESSYWSYLVKSVLVKSVYVTE
ncbi:hypothetical protein Tco_1482187 [Tanacetum coccineum]